MSFSSDVVELFRQQVEEQIADLKDGLVVTPAERSAGRIQGLQQSLAILAEVYQAVNESKRPPESKS
jgi:hypothetical protein